MSFLALLFVVISTTVAQAGTLRVPDESRQAVVVITNGWMTPTGKLQRWSRGDTAARWERVGEVVAVQVGERGLAWGLGLHGTPPAGEPRKSEGDRRAPAGVFRLTSAFGRTAKSGIKLPWRQVTSSLEAVDDPASRFYNQIVDRTAVRQPDWDTSEKMALIPDYQLGIVVAHNPRNIPGAGSCIFLHLWLGSRRGTMGCTILRQDDLAELVRWLDPVQQPVLIQLPRAVAARDLQGF